MTGALRVLPRRWATALWLTLVWCLLWGSFEVGTVVAGVLVSVGVLLVGQVQQLGTTGSFRPVAALRFVGLFLGMLLRSTLGVARLVFVPRDQLRRAVVAVPVKGASDPLLTLVANAVSLTPGTLSLDVERSSGMLFVHVLLTGSLEGVRTDVQHLERLAVLAFGSGEARAALSGQQGQAVDAGRDGGER